MVGAVGRPRALSKAQLVDAAEELFLELGYQRVSVEQIAQRAGVGRTTFFNYFAAKADLLWSDVDEALAALEAAFDAPPTDARDLVRRVTDLVGDAPVRALPLVVTEAEAMRATGELQASGLARAARLAAVLRRALRAAGRDERDAAIAAGALSGAMTAAWLAWARSGTARGPLDAALTDAADPLARALDAR